MSPKPFRGPSRGPVAVLSLAACLALAGPAAGTDLARFQRQNEVEAQKIEAEVTEALADARRLERTNPETAVRRLEKAVLLLEEARGLDAARRDALLQSVR